MYSSAIYSKSIVDEIFSKMSFFNFSLDTQHKTRIQLLYSVVVVVTQFSYDYTYYCIKIYICTRVCIQKKLHNTCKFDLTLCFQKWLLHFNLTSSGLKSLNSAFRSLGLQIITRVIKHNLGYELRITQVIKSPKTNISATLYSYIRRVVVSCRVVTFKKMILNVPK